MGRRVLDLRNKTFGSLTAISIHHMDSRYGAVWLCKCICGKEYPVLAINLKSGEVSSCGCQHKINASLLHLDNLKGKRFGKLIVIERDDDYIDPKGNHRTRWKCLCDCEKETSVLASSLKNGTTTSCGCIKIKDLAGQRFGKLIVISMEHNFRGRVRWLCKCDCGNTCIILASSLKQKQTTSCGCLKESNIAVEVKKYCEKKYKAILEYKILKNPKTNHYLPYDIYIPNHRVFIEIQGEQHYRFVDFWHKSITKFLENKRIDKMKRKFAKQNGQYIEIDLRKIKTVKEAITYIENIIGK